MEPLDPDVPAGRKPPRLTVASTTSRLAPADLVAPAALGGAAVLALSSRGDVLLLAVLLGVGAGRATSGVAVTLAAVAVAIRFGGTGLEPLASAQAVLGPAALIGSATGAASSWWAAAAVVLAAPCRRRPGPLLSLAVAVPFGATAGALAFGPGPGGDLWVRAVASVSATAMVVVVARLGRWARAVALLAVVAGTASLLLAAAA